MRRLALIVLLVFDTVALAQETPFATELQAIDEANLQLKQSIQDAAAHDQTRQGNYQEIASQLAQILGPMLWPHELSGPDVAAQASLDGLVRLANSARVLSEQGAKYDEIVAINNEVQALIFQARFAIRRAERDARLAARLGVRDQRAAQEAQDHRRQNAHLAAAQQQRASADAAHQRRMQESQRAAQQARALQNQENARSRARAQRSNRFRRIAGIAANAAASSRPAARRPRATRRPQRTHVTSRTTVRTSPGRTRTTTVRVRARTP